MRRQGKLHGEGQGRHLGQQRRQAGVQTGPRRCIPRCSPVAALLIRPVGAEKAYILGQDSAAKPDHVEQLLPALDHLGLQTVIEMSGGLRLVAYLGKSRRKRVKPKSRRPVQRGEQEVGKKDHVHRVHPFNQAHHLGAVRLTEVKIGRSVKQFPLGIGCSQPAQAFGDGANDMSSGRGFFVKPAGGNLIHRHQAIGGAKPGRRCGKSGRVHRPQSGSQGWGGANQQRAEGFNHSVSGYKRNGRRLDGKRMGFILVKKGAPGALRCLIARKHCVLVGIEQHGADDTGAHLIKDALGALGMVATCAACVDQQDDPIHLAGPQRGIGHGQDGRGATEHIIGLCTQLGQGVGQMSGAQDRGRVCSSRPGREQVDAIDRSALQRRRPLQRHPIGEPGRKPRLITGAKEFMQLGPTEIAINHNDAVTCLGHDDGQVGESDIFLGFCVHTGDQQGVQGLFQPSKL